MVSGDGETIVADFGSHGLKRWTEADGWQALTPANVESEAVSFDGEPCWPISAAAGQAWTEGNGWTKLSSGNAQNSFLSEDGDAVVADFGLGGLRRWSEGNGWFTATNADPLHIAVDATCKRSTRISLRSASCGGDRDRRITCARMSPPTCGVWPFPRMEKRSRPISSWRGLQSWTESGGWVKLSPMITEHLSISPDGQTVVADFGTRGLAAGRAPAGKRYRAPTRRTRSCPPMARPSWPTSARTDCKSSTAPGRP